MTSLDDLIKKAEELSKKQEEQKTEKSLRDKLIEQAADAIGMKALQFIDKWMDYKMEMWGLNVRHMTAKCEDIEDYTRKQRKKP